MGWTKVEVVKPHVCDVPTVTGHGVGLGDFVRCDCGVLWKCHSVDWGMQWDPFDRGVLKWTRTHEVPQP